MNKKLMALLAIVGMTAPVFAAYSAVYNVSDIVSMGIDLGGTVINAFIGYADSIVGLGILVMLMGAVGLVISAAFGLFTAFRGRLFK